MASLFAGTSALAAPGEHITAGQAVIAPSIDVGFQFRSNPYLSEGAAASGNEGDRVRPSVNFQFAPALDVNVESADVRFNFAGRYELTKYFTAQHSNLDRYNNFDVNTALDVLPTQVVGFRISDHARTRSFSSDVAWKDNALFAQFRNDLGGLFIVRFGPTLSAQAGMDWSFHEYRVPGASGESRLDIFDSRHEFGPQAAVQWNFFPRTALVFEGSYHLHRWRENLIVNDNPPTAVPLADSNHLKMMTGIRGRLTNRSVVALMVGYGSAKYLENSVTDEASADGVGGVDSSGFALDLPGIDRLLILARLQYDLGFGQTVSFQYRKDFTDSFFTNFEAYHDLYAQLDSKFGERFSTMVRYGVKFEDFDGSIARRDVFQRVQLDTTLKAQDWVSVSLGGYWMQRASSQTDIQYDDVGAMLSSTFTY